MEEKEITKTIYIANDGKEFLAKEDCKKYEDLIEKVLSRIEYFCIRCNPDLTETGYFQNKIYVAVFSKHGYNRDIAIEWAIRKFKCYLGFGVQGYGFQPHFNVSEISKKEYEGCLKLGYDKEFLSPVPVEGFPENINYMKEWGFK